ncbi:hypothetical protein MMC22_004645 [Lobaria immixta]|nr:hypothetical protein [Lobaria immixta]
MGLPQSYKAGDETTVEAFAKISCAFRQVPAAKACVNFCRSEWKDGCMEDVGRPAIQRDAERQWLLDTSYNDKHPTFESPQFASFNHEVHYFFDLRATKYELATNLNRAVALRCGAFHTSGNALGAHLTLDDPEGLTSRHPGTCGWILENEQFRSRKTSSGNDILWLHGAPGSGKTVLSSFVVDQLRVEAKVSDIIFFYHQRQDSVDPAKELLRGIIQAIFSKSISFAIGLQNLSTSLNKTQGPLWPQAFRRYLTSILGNVPSNVSVYLILDVLDECNSVENVLLNEVLDLGGQLAEPRCQLKCLFSSRNNYYVRTSWGRELRINLDGELDVQKDIARFINDENIRLSEKFPAHRTHLNAVRDIILRHAQGLFLWARLVLNEFTRDILSSTEKLPTRTSHLPPNLDVIFQQCLSTIPSRYSILAARKFAWISCALRPLHLWELRDAILVGSTHASAFPSLKELDGIEGPNSEASILEHCGGLVFTSNDQTLHYVHHSVKEFLLGDRGSSSVSVFKIDSIQAQELLALTCLESLICEQICRGDLTGRTISSQPSGILDYASANWAYHYRLAEAGSHYLTNKLQLYLQYSMNIQHSILTGSKQEVDTSSNGYRNSILKICLQSGFVGLAKIYLEMGIGVDTVFNPCGAAPLHLAVANGHLTVVDMLIKKGANLNSRTHNQGYTGLHIAVFQANNALMLRLLEAGADPNEVVANSAETPLHRAVMAEDLDAVRLLLDFGANPNATTFFMKKTPLNLVAALGRGEVLEDLHLSQFHWCDIFLRAVKKSGNVKLPLLRGYALTASCNRNPMWRENQFSNENTRSGEHISGAARNIEVSLSNSDGWTPLHFAAAQGNDKIANLLIENGAQTDAETTEGRTPFMLASEHGHDVMAATLLSNLFNSGKDIWSSQYAGNFLL